MCFLALVIYINLSDITKLGEWQKVKKHQTSKEPTIKTHIYKYTYYNIQNTVIHLAFHVDSRLLLHFAMVLHKVI